MLRLEIEIDLVAHHFDDSRRPGDIDLRAGYPYAAVAQCRSTLLLSYILATDCRSVDDPTLLLGLPSICVPDVYEVRLGITTRPLLLRFPRGAATWRKA